MKIMNASRKAMLRNLIYDGDSFARVAIGDKNNQYNHHEILKKGSDVSKEDYDFAIKTIGQKIAYLQNAINVYKDAKSMLEGLRK